MKVISSVKSLQKIANILHQERKTIGFIPTMGALHTGHLSLVKKSKEKNDVTIVSIFVNPTQFAPSEDLNKYPRPIEKDKKLLIEEGTDYLFYPSKEEIYPEHYETYVTVTNLSKIIEGEKRPGHYTGVATIVLKLFNLITPDDTYFGQKDFQQCLVIKQMIKDLNLPIRFHMVPTARDFDGLALSSRNIYLNSQERQQALVLSRSLQSAKKIINNGEKNPLTVIKKMKEYFSGYKLANIDYIEIRNADDLSPIKTISSPVVILIAAYVGKTRLIDNIII